MIFTTTDPITGEHLESLRFKPYVIEGEGRLAVKIYFDSEESRRTYLQRHRKEDHTSADKNLPA
ncbi:MAG: hypothetical protein KJO66_03380 [Gammaproteobacteria bacterium]|nr:hypothetical protein [Gammaproteobacteria bacterium]